jgi:hypothetical protein
MEKFVKDNTVAIVLNKDYGNAFSSNIFPKELAIKALFDPVLIKALLINSTGTTLKEVDKKAIEAYIYNKYEWKGNVETLSIVWIPVGTQFIVNEYDGFESILSKDEINWISA